MKMTSLSHLAAAALAVACLAGPVQAATRSASFSNLSASATVANTLHAGDTLLLNTVVPDEFGALLQTVRFTLGADVASLDGFAAWQISTAAGLGPRLIGVNLDLFDASNARVTSDSLVGVLGGFAHSTFASAIGPGTYTLTATGTGVRESVLNVSLSFAPAVPEPHSQLLMLAGMGMLGLLALQRRRNKR